MPQLVVQATLMLLVLAAIVFTYQIVRQARSDMKRDTSFPMVLVVVIIGWILTEAVTEALGTSLGIIGDWAHLSVMFLFAMAATLQLKRAMRN